MHYNSHPAPAQEPVWSVQKWHHTTRLHKALPWPFTPTSSQWPSMICPTPWLFCLQNLCMTSLCAHFCYTVLRAVHPSLQAHLASKPWHWLFPLSGMICSWLPAGFAPHHHLCRSSLISPRKPQTGTALHPPSLLRSTVLFTTQHIFTHWVHLSPHYQNLRCMKVEVFVFVHCIPRTCLGCSVWHIVSTQWICLIDVYYLLYWQTSQDIFVFTQPNWEVLPICSSSKKVPSMRNWKGLEKCK